MAPSAIASRSSPNAATGSLVPSGPSSPRPALPDGVPRLARAGVGVVALGLQPVDLGRALLDLALGRRLGVLLGVGRGLLVAVGRPAAVRDRARARAQLDDVGRLAALVDDPEPDVLERLRQPAGPDERARVRVHDRGREGLREPVDRRPGHRPARDLARVAHLPDDALHPLAPQPVERAQAGAVAVGRRVAQLVPEAHERGDVVRPLARHLVHDPRRHRRLREPADALRTDRVARRLDPLRGGRARHDELLQRQREEVVDERVDVERVLAGLLGRGARRPARAHDAQRRTPGSGVRPLAPSRAASRRANAASVTTGTP
ncbi:hypothetical protein QVL82_14635 [Cellulosimicrobium funkei]|uniref:hypothetical protein n=1 Tax=Cellulosimicrobium funkei TaxID=264251 RepID=UPI0037580434